MEAIQYDACVGCGFCCIKTRCDASLRVWPSDPTNDCPALLWTGDRYVCDLVSDRRVGSQVAKYRAELYIGDGCCCNLNDWRRSVIPRRAKDIETEKPAQLDPLFQIFLGALGKEFISGDSLALATYRFMGELVDRGYDREEAKALGAEVLYKVSEQRSSLNRNFMG